MQIAEIDSLLKLAKIIKGSEDVLEQKIVRLSAPGENYMSDIYKLSLKLNKKNTKNNEDSVDLVVKFAAAAHLDMNLGFFATQIFKSEIYWYRELVPRFERFQKQFGVTGFTDCFPKYFGSRMNLDGDDEKIDQNGLIMLEYLADYQNINKQIGFDLSATKSILAVLAKFHSMSIAFKRTYPDEFNEQIEPRLGLLPKLEDEYPSSDSGPYDYLDIMKHLDSIPNNFTNVQRSKVEDALKNYCFKLPEAIEPWAGITHCDFWVNNIMLHKRDPSKVKMVDLQVVSHTSVLSDLAFFLILSVQNQVLIEHLDELLKLYYTEFIANLHRLNITDAEHIYTYDGYLNEIGHQVKICQLSHAMYISFVMYQEKPNSHEDVVPITTKLKPTELHKKRMLQILDICLQRNWI